MDLPNTEKKKKKHGEAAKIGRQRTMPQIKKQQKSPEKELN